MPLVACVRAPAACLRVSARRFSHLSNSLLSRTMRFSAVFAVLLSILLFASISAAQPAAPFLWTWSPNTGDIEAQYSIATPYVIPVIQSGSQLAGIDIAAGKQLWAVKTANLSACPLQDGCYFYPTQFAYDNSSDLLFVAIAAQNASTCTPIHAHSHIDTRGHLGQFTVNSMPYLNT